MNYVQEIGALTLTVMPWPWCDCWRKWSSGQSDASGSQLQSQSQSNPQPQVQLPLRLQPQLLASPSYIPQVSKINTPQQSRMQPTPTPPAPGPAKLAGPSSSSSASASPPLASVLLEPVSSVPPSPPNWRQFLLRASFQIQSPYLRIPVKESSAEYREIIKLARVGPDVRVTLLDRVVNPELWSRFLRARAGLLISKSTDLTLLLALGLTDAEIALKKRVLLNFDNSALKGSPYCDNVVLLFHGTKAGPDLVDKILSEGLDERLARDGCLFGRGIYFTDNPTKAMSYDTSGVLIICAVMLGDCLNVHQNNLAARRGHAGAGARVVDSGTVREPPKEDSQKRNPQDLFFDSIVGRRKAGENEYVIFNRALCCPLYAVAYTKLDQSTATATSTSTSWMSWGPHDQAKPCQELTESRDEFTSFAWTIKNADADGNSQQSVFQRMSSLLFTHPKTVAEKKSPFYAATIFQAIARNMDAHAHPDPWDFKELDDDDQSNDNPEDKAEKRKIALMTELEELGFKHTAENERILRAFAFDQEHTIAHLTEAEAGTAAPAPASTPTAISSAAPQTEPAPTPTPALPAPEIPAASRSPSAAGPLEEECLICTVKYPVPAPAPTLPTPTPAPMTVTATAASSSSPTKTKRSWWRRLMRRRGRGRGSAGSSVGIHGHLSAGSGTGTTANVPVPVPAAATATRTGDWETLLCSHKLCTTCADRIRTTGTTMSDQKHSWIKCPFCQSVTGIQIGDCPTGTMIVTKLPTHRPDGYKGERDCVGTISITYNVPNAIANGGHSFNRFAYLPDNPEGRAILELLRIAWDRRLIFTVGTSLTTGQSNVLVWNIHHKTALGGGPAFHGYPDPGYFQRVRDELAQCGIK